jgi:uncharacterized membrane protein YtjA (UPF0391 family)
MLEYGFFFLFLAGLAAILGFVGLVGLAALFAKGLLVVFLGLFVLSAVRSRPRL